MTALDQVFEQGTVSAALGSVADQGAAGGEQGEAAQIRQGALQGAHQGLLLFGGARWFKDGQQVQGDLRAQGHVLADLLGQVGAVVDGVLLLVFLVLLQLVQQLPEQQGEQQQDKRRQRAFQGAVQGRSRRNMSGAQGRGRRDVGQTVILRFGWTGARRAL